MLIGHKDKSCSALGLCLETATLLPWLLACTCQEGGTKKLRVSKKSASSSLPRDHLRLRRAAAEQHETTFAGCKANPSPFPLTEWLQSKRMTAAAAAGLCTQPEQTPQPPRRTQAQRAAHCKVKGASPWELSECFPFAAECFCHPGSVPQCKHRQRERFGLVVWVLFFIL